MRLRSPSGAELGSASAPDSNAHEAWGQQLALTSLQPLQLTLKPPGAEGEGAAVSGSGLAPSGVDFEDEAEEVGQGGAAGSSSADAAMRDTAESSDAWSHLNAEDILQQL